MLDAMRDRQGGEHDGQVGFDQLAATHKRIVAPEAGLALARDACELVDAQASTGPGGFIPRVVAVALPVVVIVVAV